ncbi:SIS domain-containing protein [Nocardioides sp. DS6]|uniref:SIS domain-containing protein n=1 Tax=Nocardioides eburneus TaxID=3231482 RepID=A0ABV3SZD1_9ACTN
MSQSPAAVPAAFMRAEIAEQPDVFRRILTAYDTEIAPVRQAIQRRRPRLVQFVARGSSDHAALYAKYVVEVLGEVPAGLISASTFTVYRRRPDLSDALVVAVSQSGGSPDLVESVRQARLAGAFTVAVTNAPGSALAEAADRHVTLHAGPERSVAATKSYTAELLTLYLLLAPEIGGLAGLPDVAAAVIAGFGDIAAGRDLCSGVTRLVTTGRGYAYPTAREAALKLMETCYISAQAFSAADLMHGPLAMIDDCVPVIGVLPPGEAGAAMAPVLGAIRDRGAPIWTVGAKGDFTIDSAGLPDALSPLLEILPLQQLAMSAALDRGIDPDRPRGLRKVTQTR